MRPAGSGGSGPLSLIWSSWALMQLWHAFPDRLSPGEAGCWTQYALGCHAHNSPVLLPSACGKCLQRQTHLLRFYYFMYMMNVFFSACMCACLVPEELQKQCTLGLEWQKVLTCEVDAGSSERAAHAVHHWTSSLKYFFLGPRKIVWKSSELLSQLCCFDTWALLRGWWLSGIARARLNIDFLVRLLLHIG